MRGAARACARRPKRVIALWLALIVACFAGGAIAGTHSLSDVDSGAGQSRAAAQRLERAGMINSFTENVIVRSGSAAATRHTVAVLAAGAKRIRYVISVRSPATDPPLARDGGRTGLVVVTLRGDPDEQDAHVEPLARFVDRAAARAHGVYVGEAGDGSGERAMNTLVSNGLHTAEMIALPITLVILVLAFGALVAAVVPLVLGLTSVAAAMGALGVVSHIAPEGSTTAPVVILIGLAVGVDYSLFYIRRERAERRLGAGPDAALDAAAQTVGRAIVIAGATVIIGLAGLLFTGNAVFVSMALGAILVVAIAVLGSLTVLPAVLALLGDKIDRGRLWGRRRSAGAGSRTARAWGAFAGAITARPRLSLALALIVLAGLAAPILSMHTGDPGIRDAPRDAPIRVAQRTIDDAFPGANDMAQLVVAGHRLGSERDTLLALGHRGRRITGNAAGQVSVQISRDGDTALVEIPVKTGGIDIERRNTDTLRQQLLPATERALPNTTAQLTGNDASDVDFTDQMHRITPLVIAFVLGLAFVLLVCSFGSPLLAASVIGLNLMSVAAAFGVLTLVFEHHWAQSAARLSVVRRDRQLAAAVRVCGPVRPLDGLHGADPRAGARGTPRRGRRPRCGLAGTGRDRRDRHRRRARDGRGVRDLRGDPARVVQAARGRAGRRDRTRRDDRARDRAAGGADPAGRPRPTARPRHRPPRATVRTWRACPGARDPRSRR